MRISKLLTLFFSFLVFYSFSQGQKPYGQFSNSVTKKTEKKLLKQAHKEVDYGRYSRATEKYIELLKLDSTNPMYNFEEAQNLYNNFHQPQSIPYFERAIKYCRDSIGEAYYFLGSAYHLAGQFDQAQMNYRIYQSILNYRGTALDAEEEKDLKAEIKHKIEMCDNGKALYRTPPADKITINGKVHSFRIENAGVEINSDYDDYGEVLANHDSVMAFTSRKPRADVVSIDWDDKFFEDIYMSNADKNGWSKSFPIGAPINTAKHEAVIGMSADGKTIYFYRGIKQGTFFFSTLKDNVWSNPSVLFQNGDMNTNSWETSFFGFSVAGNELYVVSDRSGGLGARDIFVSTKQEDGTWGALKDIGAPVNTQYDEDAPFITADGKTMYFSSKGHNSMGGFDIFRSERQGDGWSEPVNLGLPFNTPGEDIFFIIASTSDRAYYSSSSLAPDGSKDIDIYMIEPCDDAPETLLSGVTFNIPYATISITDKASGQKVADVRIEDGKYAVRLKHGAEYLFTLNYPSVIEPVSVDVSIPKLCKLYELYQEISFQQPGQPVVFRNAFFDMKKATTGAGAGNYSDYLSKLDKNTYLYSEISVPTSVLLAKIDLAKITPVNAGTVTVTAATTSITAAATHSVEVTTTATTTSVTPTGTTETITTISINNILFDYDKSTLNRAFTSELDKVVEFLKKAKNAGIEISGHADSKGTDEYNLNLSKRRADAVASYFISKGISRGRIKTSGNGESKPIAANENQDGSDNPDGRAKNRRTEITVIQ